MTQGEGTPKVSIIMGIYQCGDTLAEALDSIWDQSLQDWELILCDDGSTDNTYAVAEGYRQRDPQRVTLLRNETNQGLNITLNRCLERSRGVYVARMDGDDRSVPTRLEVEAAFLDSHPEYAIVSSAMRYFDGTCVWGPREVIPCPQIRDFVFHAPVHCHAPCMIRREAYLAVGGYTVDRRLLRFEDCNLWYKLYAAGYRGYNLQQPLYEMRDDRNAYRRRTLSSRLRAVYVQWSGFRLVGMPLRYYPYLLVELGKNLALGLMPAALYQRLHRGGKGA